MRRILVAIGFFLAFSMPSLAQTTKENTSITNAIESFLSNYCIEKKHSSEPIHINKLQIDNSKKTINISISNSFANIEITSKEVKKIFKGIRKNFLHGIKIIS